MSEKKDVSGCKSCCDISTEKYLILLTKKFKIILDDRRQLFPGQYIIVALDHIHPTEITKNKDLFNEIQHIKFFMERTIRNAFGTGTTSHRGIKFNYCRLGNSTYDPTIEHYHEFCVPVSGNQFECEIGGLGYIFSYPIFEKPFDNTLRNYPNDNILKWIHEEIKKNLVKDIYPSELMITENFNKNCECNSCKLIMYEKAPLFETKYFKVVLNDKRQYGPGRMFVVCKYHIDMSEMITDEFFVILQYIEKLIYKFYDDTDKKTTRIHVCQLGNMSGKPGNTHSFWHIIPRTSKPLVMTINKDTKIIFKDIHWNTSFNNNVTFVPSTELLEYLRQKIIKLIEGNPDIRPQCINIVNKFPSPLPSLEIKDCVQCDNAKTDEIYTLFKTQNFRIILNLDQRIPGRSLIIALNHIHPDKFKESFHLIIEQSIVELLLHKTFVICYGYQRCQLLKLGNLTKTVGIEHQHTHYIPSTPNEIIINYGDTKVIIKDDRWGLPTNLEATLKIKRSDEFMQKIRSDFKKNFINIYDVKDEIYSQIFDNYKDNLLSDCLEFTINNIFLNLNVII